jgi:hypothetical protein
MVLFDFCGNRQSVAATGRYPGNPSTSPTETRAPPEEARARDVSAQPDVDRKVCLGTEASRCGCLDFRVFRQSSRQNLVYEHGSMHCKIAGQAFVRRRFKPV